MVGRSSFEREFVIRGSKAPGRSLPLPANTVKAGLIRTSGILMPAHARNKKVG